MMRFSLVIALGAGTMACKPSIVHKLTTAAYIIGPDNMRRMDNHGPVDLSATPPPEELIKSLAATAVLIVTPLTTGETRFCSGNIYNGPAGPVVLTNRHCFAPDKDHSTKSGGADPWACEKTQVYRNFDVSTALPSTRNGCAKDSLKVNSLLDLATFKLAGPGVEAGSPDPLPRGLDLRKTDPQPGERINAMIVHFPDIEGQRVRMDLAKLPGAPMTIPRMTITWEDCRTAGYFKVETYNVDPSLPYAIRHTCDMIKGSSGSSLVDAGTGESLGVNWGGIKFGDAKDDQVFNIATRATLASSFLSMGGSELDQLLLSIAEKPPEGTVGNGEADALVERSGKSRHLTVAGCARIQGHGAKNVDQEMPTPFDMGWVFIGIVMLSAAFWRGTGRDVEFMGDGATPSRGAGVQPGSHCRRV